MLLPTPTSSPSTVHAASSNELKHEHGTAEKTAVNNRTFQTTVPNKNTSQNQPAQKFSALLYDLNKATKTSTATSDFNKQSNLRTFSLVKPEPFSSASSILPIEISSEPLPRPIAPIALQVMERPSRIRPMTVNTFEEFQKIPEIDEMPQIELMNSEKEGKGRGASWDKSSVDKDRRMSAELITARSFVQIPNRNTREACLLKNVLKESKQTGLLKHCLHKRFSRRVRNSEHTKVMEAQVSYFEYSVRKFNEDRLVKRHIYSNLHKGARKIKTSGYEAGKRVFIPPPKTIDPINKVIENFEVEKDIGNINEHTIDIEKMKEIEEIKNHLQDVKTPPQIKPIEIQPVANVEEIPNLKS